MKITLRRLTMTAVLLSTSVAFAANPQRNTYVGDTEADYYGDEYYPEDDAAYAVEDNEVQQASAVHIGDGAPAAPPQAGYYYPPTATVQPAGFRKHHAMAMSGSCDSGCDASCGGCDGGCDSCSPRHGMMGRMMNNKCSQTWLQAETLLWFPQSRRTTPLVVLAPAGEFPFLDNPNATVALDEFGNNISPGARLDFGRYFNDGNVGIGGRFWGLSDDDDSFRFGGDGTDVSIGRPFFNAGLGVEDAVIIGFEAGGNDDFTGEVSGEASLQMFAAEAYGRLNLGRSRDYQTDIIGGYSFFGIDDDLFIRSNSIDNEDGGETTFRDSFSTENRFHGGQIGAETIIRRGRWVARSLTKVHLGNMNQVATISGSATNTAVLGAPVETFDRGLLAVGNQGVFERDEFTFAPEINLKLGYRFRDHVTFTVGYSFLYWNNVALAGQQIDRNIDLDQSNLAAITEPPTFRFQDAGFWVQGIDLGATIEF